MGPAHARDELVHDARLQAQEFVLDPLAQPGRFRPVDGIIAQGFEKGEGGHLEAGGTAEARSDGHVAPDEDVRADRGVPEPLQFISHAEDVVDPRLIRIAADVVQIGLGAPAQIGRESSNTPILPRPRQDHRLPLERHG